jgi:dTDP-4-dehydrorhamnose reductase
MAIDSILSQIDAEIARLTQARSLLANLGSVTAKVTEPEAKKAPAKAKRRKKRVLSPEARKRIADAQRKRWAAQKAKTRSK